MSGGTYVPFFYGHDWVGEFIPEALEELAAELRQKADFLDGKAGLLREQMSLASAIEARSDATPKSGAAEGESATRKGDAQ